MGNDQRPSQDGPAPEERRATASATALFRRLAARLPGELRRDLPTMIVYEICFRTIVTMLGAPLLAWLIGALVARSGSVAVSNIAILRFLLTPSGFAVAVILAMGYLVGQLLLAAGLMVIAALALSGRPMSVAHAMDVAFRSSLSLLRVGIMQIMGFAWLFAPFLGLAALTYILLLTRHDINYYLSEKPVAFLAAAAIGVALGAVLLCNLAVAYVRLLFVVPILLFEGGSSRAAFRSSRQRVALAWWTIGGGVLGWHALVALAAPLAGLIFSVAALRLIALAGAHVSVLVPLGVGLLVVQGGLLAVFAFVQVAGASILTVHFYDELSGGRSRTWAEKVEMRPASRSNVPWWAWILGAGSLLLSAVSTVSTGAQLVDAARNARPVLITAHRGASRAAPENSLSALRSAIEFGCDYAEIDVHLTFDGVPILLHDEDFLRLAGDSRRPGELTLEQIRRIDIGSKFDRAFAGERIATLKEAIDAARGKIKLNIELKPTGVDRDQLAGTVADLIRDSKFEADCFVTSLDGQAVEAAHRRNPRLRIGAIVSAAVGDVALLKVDVLSVRTGLVSDGLLEAARAGGREVHAWTIDDPDVMCGLIDRGISGVITNEPAMALSVRASRQRLPTWQRIVLSLQTRLSRM